MLDNVVALLGFVCPYSVCVLLSLSQVVVELSVWLVLNGAPRWHFEQPVQPRGTHCAHCPKRLPGLGAVWHMTCRGQAVRRCCSVSVLPLLSQFLPFILFILFHFSTRTDWPLKLDSVESGRPRGNFQMCCCFFFVLFSFFSFLNQTKTTQCFCHWLQRAVGGGGVRVVPFPEFLSSTFCLFFETNNQTLIAPSCPRLFITRGRRNPLEIPFRVNVFTRDAPIPLFSQNE